MAVPAWYLTSIAVIGGEEVVIDQGGAWSHRTTPAGCIVISPCFLPEKGVFRALPDLLQRLIANCAEGAFLYLDFLAKHPAGIGMPEEMAGHDRATGSDKDRLLSNKRAVTFRQGLL